MSAFLNVRRILVPVDLSDSSGAVLDYALDLARDRGADITLLHVVGIPLVPFDASCGVAAGPEVLEDLENAAREALVALAARAGEVPLRIRIPSGTPGLEIQRAAEEWPADLVVVGTHGRTGLRHILLGSVAESVVRRAPCPVLVVR